MRKTVYIIKLSSQEDFFVGFKRMWWMQGDGNTPNNLGYRNRNQESSGLCLIQLETER